MADYSHIALLIGAWFIQMGAHEGAHAYAAYRFGDDTSYLLGKRTFNPIAHVNWTSPYSVIMSVVVPVLTSIYYGIPLGMAWVPVNPRRFKRWERDMALVSFAGPAANLALVLICFAVHLLMLPILPFGVPTDLSIDRAIWLVDEFARVVCFTSALYGFFNLIPIPPLDGSKVLRYFLPRTTQDVLDNIEPYGMFIIMMLFWVGDAGVVIGFPLEAVLFIWHVIGGLG
jgi:Zn-dependent protease